MRLDVVDLDSNQGVEIGDGVRNSCSALASARPRLEIVLTRQLVDDVLTDVQVGFDSERPRVHGAHAFQLFLATRIKLLRHGRVAVDQQLQVGLDIAGDVGDTLDVEGQTPIAGCECDVEELS